MNNWFRLKFILIYESLNRSATYAKNALVIYFWENAKDILSSILVLLALITLFLSLSFQGNLGKHSISKNEADHVKKYLIFSCNAE